MLVTFDTPRAVAGDRGRFEDARADRLQFRGSSVERPARPQTAHHRDIENITPQLLGLAKREHDIKALAHCQAEKRGRRYSDHFLELAVQHKRGARSEFLSTHLALPIGMTDHRPGCRTRCSLVLRQNQPSSPRLDTKHAEEITADPNPVRAPHLAAFPNTNIVRGPREDARESLL